MKLVKFIQTKTYNNSDVCVATEYPVDDKDIDISLIKLNGRYPDKGSALNKKSKEIAYICKGEGEITVNGTAKKLSKGDVVFIDKNESYFWNGNMEMIVTCSPAWNPKQHTIVN